MKRLFWSILLLVLGYAICIVVWQVEQALGIGRPFVYSVF